MLRGPRMVWGPCWPRLGHLVGEDEGFKLQAVGHSVSAVAEQGGPIEDVGQFVDRVRQHDGFEVFGMHVSQHRQIVQDQTWPPATLSGNELPQIQIEARAGVGFAAFRCPVFRRDLRLANDVERMASQIPASNRPAQLASPVDQVGEVTHLRNTPVPIA